MQLKCLLLPALALSAACVWGQPLPAPQGPSIERLYQYPLINGRSPSNPNMSPDGGKIVFGWNKTGARKLDLWVMDFPSGQSRMIVEAAKILDFPRQDDTRTE